MSPSEGRMKDTGGPGIVPFEWSGGQERADEILAEWGEEGQDAARESLWIDFGFLLAYGIFLTLVLIAIRDLARERDWRRLAAIGGAVVSFGALGAAFDALENVCLLLTLERAGAVFPLLATIFTACKFALLTTAIAYLLAGVAMRLRAALSSAAIVAVGGIAAYFLISPLPIFAMAGLLGVVAVLLLLALGGFDKSWTPPSDLKRADDRKEHPMPQGPAPPGQP
jgi:hypothetical protein